jgi:hypothetical protein
MIIDEIAFWTSQMWKTFLPEMLTEELFIISFLMVYLNISLSCQQFQPGLLFLSVDCT